MSVFSLFVLLSSICVNRYISFFIVLYYFQKAATTIQQQQKQHHHQHHYHQQQHQQHHQLTCDSSILYNDNNDIELYIDSNSRSSGDLADTELEANLRHHSRNFTLSPETTDYDSNCGDLDSLSNDINCTTDYGKLYTSMPVLEDGLSSGHASDTENNCQKYESNGSGSVGGVGDVIGSNESVGILNEKLQQQEMMEHNLYNNSLKQQECMDNNCSANNNLINNLVDIDDIVVSGDGGVISGNIVEEFKQQQQQQQCDDLINSADIECCNVASLNAANGFSNNDHTNYEPIYATVNKHQQHIYQQHQQQQQQYHQHQQSPPPPPPPAPQPHRPQQARPLKIPGRAESVEIQEAMKEIRSALQRAKTQPEKLKFCDEVLPPGPESPIWVPRKNTDDCNASMGGVIGDDGVICEDSNKSHCDDEEPDTDLETDRLLGQQRGDEKDFFEDKVSYKVAI